MSDQKEKLETIKKLREMTGVGFSDCKSAIEETGGDIDKAVEFLRKKGIAKASKKMSRTANEGLVLAHKENNSVSLLEVNSETDFVAKNKDFINFCKELSVLNFKYKGDLDALKNAKMKNSSTVDESLIDLISKIGEKIIVRRAKFFDSSDGQIYYYIHNTIEKDLAGKIIAAVKVSNINENTDIGFKLAMHIAASGPLAIDEKKLDKNIINKELEIIKAELDNSGKKPEIADKIAKGKINKFISDNTLLNQPWFMDPKISVKKFLNESNSSNPINIIEFARFKLGEGI